MACYNVIIGFANEKTAKNIAEIVQTEGFNVVAVCNTVAEIRKQMSYYRGGIIISGYKLKDKCLEDFIYDVSSEFTVILVGNAMQLDMCDKEGVFKLAVPLRRADLIYSINMLMRKEEDKGYEEKKIIDSAKKILIEQNEIKEADAHRYIQKKSMQEGAKMTDIARRILAEGIYGK